MRFKVLLRFSLFLIISCIICLSTNNIFGQNCKENIAKESEEAICAQFVVEFPKVKTSEITGIVVFNGEAFEDAIVEVYKIGKDERELIAKYKTSKDGKFCFRDLPEGKYFIKASWVKFGYNCSTLYVDVKGKTKRLITIPLEVGT